MKFLNYILILLGASVAIYSKAGAAQNHYVLIVGICMLMIGVYRISKTIPNSNDEDSNY